MDKLPVFVIGDVHGHVGSLLGLLDKAGLTTTSGNDVARSNQEAIIVQLGDLGHYGSQTQGNDRDTWGVASLLVDVVLWGNHDRAVIDRGRHGFRGFVPPWAETREYMEREMPLAYFAHGFLITHAGIRPEFADNFAALSLLNDGPLTIVGRDGDVVNAIGFARGGRSEIGGILWRDDSEPLWDVPQIYGHTRHDEVVVRTSPTGNQQYNIDVASEHNAKLAGIWLPSLEIVTL